MTQTYRFGRRITLPSTRQIRHELLAMEASEDAKQRAADANTSQGIASQATRQAPGRASVEVERPAA
jgi:hypothetical protein